MKEFKVPIKSELRDYTATRDFWVSLCDHIEYFEYDSLCNKNEAVLSVFAPSPFSGYDSAGSLSDIFAQLSSACSGDLIYFHTDKGVLKSFLSGDKFWVCFQRTSKQCVVLGKGLRQTSVDLNDFVVCFDKPIPPETLDKIARDVFGSPHIAYSLAGDLKTFLDSKKLAYEPLVVLDYSPKESYQFSIKSSLNSVSLTIDMIKNKILKYHYDKIWKIETVLHEALVNAITYGNELDYDRPVVIEYEVGPRGFKIIIRDTGGGFDVSGFSVPVGMEALDQISGRGIYIMKKFSEALFFNSKGNQTMLYFEL